MKKIIVLVLCAFTLCVLFAGCDEKTEDEKHNEIGEPSDPFGMQEIRTVTINGVGQEIMSTKLEDTNAIVLKAGEICHFSEDEKQSIPYRWEYTISDENVMELFHSEYEDKSPPNTPPGGDICYRWIYFKALTSGECVISVWYGRIGATKDSDMERIYTVIVTGDKTEN